jgi:RNA polymerase sigma-70 factor (ECF subfamily)
MHENPGEVTLLLSEMAKGDKDAASRLMPLVYQELRRLAGHYMRQERPDHTLQPTALVHEAYLKLVQQPPAGEWGGRSHFFAVAAQIMRHILVDYARAKRSEKRGGAQAKVPLDEGLVFSPEKSDELLALDEALQRLEQIDPVQARIVEMHFFGGLSGKDTAEALGISERTVRRHWATARLWLHREVAKGF